MRFRGRFFTRITVVGVVLLLLVVATYYAFNAHAWTRYANESGMPCERPKADISTLVRYTHAVIDVLEELAVSYYLMYGTLWGALRNGGPLPWDYDADIGVDGDALAKYTHEQIVDAFARRRLVVTWSDRRGRYKVVCPDADEIEGIDVMPFYDYWRDGMMRRRGIESWVFFINYRVHHTFPARLVSKPLPVLSFGGRNVTVPRGGIEIQKYLYRGDWYKVVPPLGCR